MRRHTSVRYGTADAYNASAMDYVAYADGDPADPFGFSSEFSFADREIWRRIEATLIHLHASGRRTLSVLDAGCGPGTWLRRVVLRARAIGFQSIKIHGFDLSPAMITLARTGAEAVKASGTSMNFVTADITKALTYPDRHFDITLCLYAVLNHLPRAVHAQVAADLARVTSDTLMVSVRSVGSQPTIYVDKLEHAQRFHQDNEADWMDVVMQDGRHAGFPSHLFCSASLRALFQRHCAGVSMLGLDVFHSRFARNPHWNPAQIDGEDEFAAGLADLERRYAADPRFIDRATHILLIGER
jgi:SAM-dependent methyltransferase